VGLLLFSYSESDGIYPVIWRGDLFFAIMNTILTRQFRCRGKMKDSRWWNAVRRPLWLDGWTGRIMQVSITERQKGWKSLKRLHIDYDMVGGITPQKGRKWALGSPLWKSYDTMMEEKRRDGLSSILRKLWKNDRFVYFRSRLFWDFSRWRLERGGTDMILETRMQSLASLAWV
jgi:hypothetical protein